jgi:hypothetical protein
LIVEVLQSPEDSDLFVEQLLGLTIGGTRLNPSTL